MSETQAAVPQFCHTFSVNDLTVECCVDLPVTQIKAEVVFFGSNLGGGTLDATNLSFKVFNFLDSQAANVTVVLTADFTNNNLQYTATVAQLLADSNTFSGTFFSW